MVLWSHYETAVTMPDEGCSFLTSAELGMFWVKVEESGRALPTDKVEVQGMALAVRLRGA